MRIAVTGASGFIGGAIAGELSRQGHFVHAFGRRHAGGTVSLLPNYRRWDIRHPLKQIPVVDAVVHCAALVGDWGDDAEYQRTNVAGTRRVLETFRGAERFIHVSSASVYSRSVQTGSTTGAPWLSMSSGAPWSSVSASCPPTWISPTAASG